MSKKEKNKPIAMEVLKSLGFAPMIVLILMVMIVKYIEGQDEMPNIDNVESLQLNIMGSEAASTRNVSPITPKVENQDLGSLSDLKAVVEAKRKAITYTEDDFEHAITLSEAWLTDQGYYLALESQNSEEFEEQKFASDFSSYTDEQLLQLSLSGDAKGQALYSLRHLDTDIEAAEVHIEDVLSKANYTGLLIELIDAYQTKIDKVTVENPGSEQIKQAQSAMLTWAMVAKSLGDPLVHGFYTMAYGDSLSGIDEQDFEQAKQSALAIRNSILEKRQSFGYVAKSDDSMPDPEVLNVLLSYN